MSGFYETHIEQGLNPEVALLEFGIVTVDPAIAAKLREPSALRIVRLYRVDNAPLALTYSYLRSEAKRVTREQALEHPAYGILEKILGYTIGSAELTIRCESAGGSPAAHLLDLEASDPVLVLGRTSFDAAHEPLETTVCYLRPEAYEFRITMSGSVPLVRNFRHTRTTN
jgi:GntR family transcriptional regulator